MLKKYQSLALASLLAIGGFAMANGGASAAAIPLVTQYSADGAGLLQVNHRRSHNERRFWDRRRHGDRCRWRRGDCRHYYRGYYYRTPWWSIAAVPLIVGGAVIAGDRDWGDDHVEWCLNRYRSYNPRTNTYVSYNGVRRQCHSPY